MDREGWILIYSPDYTLAPHFGCFHDNQTGGWEMEGVNEFFVVR